MRYKFLLLALAVAATLVFALIGSPIWLTLTAGVVALALTIYCYYSCARPMRAILSGFDLLKSQDFSSRLRPTGWHETDIAVDLFNRMMDTLKQERLKNREQDLFLTHLLEVSPTAIAICNFDGTIQRANPAFRRFVGPELQQRLDKLDIGQSEVARLSDSSVYRCSRLYFMDSGFRRPFFIVEQITDEIAGAEQEIFKKIVRTIGHEVNNTLGSVMSVLETLGEGYDETTPEAVAIAGCRRSCADLVGFVKGYADIVKLPAINLAPTNLADELRQLIPTLQGLLPDGISLSLSTENPATELHIDMMLLSRALINIVKNAAESISAHRSAGGQITMRLSGARLAITDNGAGIDATSRNQLFTPFFSTKRPDRGLGLMLTADILRAHKASFSLSTDEATSLTTFSIQFAEVGKI